MVNAVIVGLGSISQLHIDGILKSAKLYGVCDVDKEKVVDISKKYNCKPFYNIEEALKDKNVESVHICTPHFLHFEMAKLASKYGKQIVLEKPAVMNLDEFYELNDILRKNKTKCMVVLQNRYNPCISYIREEWYNLNLGKLLGLKGILTWNRDAEYYTRSDWRGKWKTEGGGLLINQAPHTLDLLAYFGGEIEDVVGTTATRVLNDIIEVEDTTEATIYFKNGIKAFFYGTNGYAKNSTYDIELAFEKGCLRYNYGELLLVTDDKIEIVARDMPRNGEKAYWGLSHNIIVDNFYNGKDYPTFLDYEPTAKILNKLLRSPI